MSGPDRSNYAHATALVLGETGVLIRGASGAGKSRLAALLIAEAQRRGLFARLVGDDRVALAAHGGRIVARGHPVIAGLIERRGQGVVNVPFEAACVLGCVIDLLPDGSARLPLAADNRVELLGLDLRRVVLRADSPDLSAADVLDRLLAEAKT